MPERHSFVFEESYGNCLESIQIPAGYALCFTRRVAKSKDQPLSACVAGHELETRATEKPNPEPLNPNKPPARDARRFFFVIFVCFAVQSFLRVRRKSHLVARRI